MVLASPVINVGDSDLYRRALLESGARGPLLVERPDGELSPTRLAWWLRQRGAEEPDDVRHLAAIDHGPVLDVGCATGRHLEHLAARSVKAVGIDIVEPAISLARQHGHDAHLANIWTYRPPRRFRWILLLGNNLGIATNLDRLPLFLRHCRELLTDDGRILVTSVDHRTTEWMAPVEAAYPGDLKLRHRYGAARGPWFPWLYVDAETLTHYAAGEGFTFELLSHCRDSFCGTLSVGSGNPDTSRRS